MEDLFVNWIDNNDGEEISDPTIVITKRDLKYYLYKLPTDLYDLISIS